MAEYIEREATLAELDKSFKLFEEHDDIIRLYSDSRSSVIYAPAADVVEVVHGEWVNVTHALVDSTGDCTKCGKQAVWRTTNKPYIICPNCGAKMDGATNGH